MVDSPTIVYMVAIDKEKAVKREVLSTHRLQQSREFLNLSRNEVTFDG